MCGEARGGRAVVPDDGDRVLWEPLDGVAMTQFFRSQWSLLSLGR
jgi:hypothetical protein